MIGTDFETRQLLALEHTDMLARDFRSARRTRPDEDASVAAPRLYDRVLDAIRSLPRVKPSHAHRPQEV
jgi:hypothetical protein